MFNGKYHFTYAVLNIHFELTAEFFCSTLQFSAEL